MTNSPSVVRTKATDIDTVLEPIDALLAGSDQTFRYMTLQGDQVSFRVADEITDKVGADPHPLPMPVDREGYGAAEHSVGYWAGGRSDLKNVVDAIDRHGPNRDASDQLKLLDFGCATGRVLRHALADPSDQFDCWGCDFAPANVDWVKRYLPGDIKVFLNTAIPHLPFPDGFFDVVTAFSVFTHIDELEDAWLLELRRITAPDGLLYITVHNDATWRTVKDRPKARAALLRSSEQAESLTGDRSIFDSPMTQDRLVLRMSESDIYNCNVWVTDAYIRETWARYFEVVDIADNAHLTYQSVVLLKPLG